MPPQTLALADTATTRLSNIKAFLARPPKNAVKLVLSVEGEEESSAPLAVWEERDDFKPSLAVEVLALVEAAASEERVAALRCKLAYVSELGEDVKKLRIIHRDEGVRESQYGAQPGELTGTTLSLLIQSQKHTEMALRLMADSQVKVLAQSQQLSQHACDMVAMLAQRIAETEQRSAESDARMREAQEALHRATHADTPEEKAEGLQKFADLLMPMLPVLMQRLLPAAAASTAS